jgi:hypothetical protein
MIRRRLTFSRATLAAGVVGAVAVGAGPLMREAAARFTWREVPCYLSPDGRRFVFIDGGRRYYCGRPNMWHVANADAREATADTPPPPANDHCYVNAATPPTAVLRLDAHRHLAGGVGNFAAAGLLLAAAGAVAFATRERLPPGAMRDPAPPLEAA